jgi:D-xylose 1-dehydrogenase (NADP+, D-xylono-1,5-lactone-forming)
MTADASRPLRWGLMGTARVNRHVIPALRASSRHVLVAVASRDRARGDAYAREWAIPRALLGYQSLLDDPDVQAVYISLPNSLHVPWTLAALEAGKHVLCEKPMALDPLDVDRIAAAAAAARCHVAEGYVYRHEPQTDALRTLVDRGAIGTLRTMTGAFTYPQSRLNDVRLDPALGGGSLWDVGCYPVSFASFIAGGPPVEVMGWASLGPSGVDEMFSGMLRYASGVTARIDCGFRAVSRTWMEIAGSDGVLVVAAPFKPGAREEIALRRHDGHQVIAIDGSRTLFVRQVDDFAAAALDGAPPVVPLAESRAIAGTLAALHESARLNRPVCLT